MGPRPVDMEGRRHADKNTFGRVFVQDFLALLIRHPDEKSVRIKIVAVRPQVGGLEGLVKDPGDNDTVVAP